MKPYIFSVAALATLMGTSLSARELMCEQCEPEPCCFEHLFVERSQFFLHGEFLYWSVKEGALDYAVKMQQPDPENFGSLAIGKYKAAEYDWDPGFRVALSYYRCHKYWEITGQYTRFHDSGKNSVNAPTEEDAFLNPTRPLFFGSDLERATSDINFEYDLGDLYVARVFDPNPHLRLRLFGGITGGRLEQDLKLSYTTEDDVTNYKESWRFSGGGLRVGLTSDWYWCGCFYLTARVSFAGLLGSYKNQEVVIQTFRDSDEFDLRGDATYDEHRMSFHSQFLLGPSWQVPCDCWSYEIFAGWEFNLWSNIHERILTEFSPANDTKTTNYASNLLGMQGFTLRATFGF